jgi:hypothetical protein
MRLPTTRANYVLMYMASDLADAAKDAESSKGRARSRSIESFKQPKRFLMEAASRK